VKYLVLFIIIFCASHSFAQEGGKELPKEITEGQDKKGKQDVEADEMLQMGPKLKPKEKKKLKKILKKYELTMKEKTVMGKNESGAPLTNHESRVLAKAQRKKALMREKIHDFSVEKNLNHQNKDVRKRMIANRKMAYKYGSRTDRRSFWEKLFPPRKTEYKEPPKEKKQASDQNKSSIENK